MLITFENEVKMIRNSLIINVMFIQNDTLWVYAVDLSSFFNLKIKAFANFLDLYKTVFRILKQSYYNLIAFNF